MDTKYGIHLTSSDVVREAKEYLLHTTRPETPRYNHSPVHEPVQITKIDMGERKSSSRSIRLNPIGPESVPTRQSRLSPRPRGSAETRVESIILELESADIPEKFGLCSTFCKIVKRHPHLSQSQQERVLTICSSLLSVDCLDLPQRIQVSSVLLLLELGPINLSVLGANLFKISSNSKQFFENQNLTEGLVRELDSADELFLLTLNKLLISDSAAFINSAKKMNVLDQIRRAMARIVTESQNASPEKLKESEKKMVLLLEAARQLVEVSELFHQVEQDSQFVAIWLHCIQTFIESENVIQLCARLMSVSTQSVEFCTALQRKEKNWMLHVAQAVERYIKKADIVVRFMYAVGNGAACGHCHLKFVKTVRRVLTFYVKNNKFGKLETDVILKSIRVCANFALEESGANALVADSGLIKLFIKLFRIVLTEKAKFSATEELLKFIIATLNNIIYFTSINFEQFAPEAASLFIKCLMGEQMVIMSESCRALGNLSRYSCVREQFSLNEADKLLIALLDSPDVNIVQHVIGILINFTLEADCSSLFMDDNDNGLKKLLAAMTEFGDWNLATLVIQLLWNILRYDNTVLVGSRKHAIVQSIVAVSSLFPDPTNATEAHLQRSFFEVSEKFKEQIIRI